VDEWMTTGCGIGKDLEEAMFSDIYSPIIWAFFVLLYMLTSFLKHILF